MYDTSSLFEQSNNMLSNIDMSKKKLSKPWATHNLNVDFYWSIETKSLVVSTLFGTDIVRHKAQIAIRTPTRSYWWGCEDFDISTSTVREQHVYFWLRYTAFGHESGLIQEYSFSFCIYMYVYVHICLSN